MGEISAEISNLITSYSEFTGQNYPLHGQGLRHESKELIDRGGFRLQSVIRVRSSQVPIFQLPSI